ncbi:MAG TPA: APC family permease [Chthonomonadaceae bacterium]|nr:APC family permease [Chthonomonadaceae bacterium]
MMDTLPPNESQEPTPMVTLAPEPMTLGKRLRLILFGNPISSEHHEHTLLPKITALPVFSSDAISSVAYATQQIVLALAASGLWLKTHRDEYTHYTLLVSGLIVLLLAIVVTSYWQTIFGYPSGGGSYIVSKDNLGTMPGLIAAGALLIDYVLTVSVSIASGVQNLEDVPLFSPLHVADHLVLYCVLAILVLVLANLRGLKESGTLFALPTYGFIVCCYVLILLGLFGHSFGWQMHMEGINEVYNTYPFKEGMQGAEKVYGSLSTVVLIGVLLKAFANGCSAMTGTEAVSNGIPAFRPPKSRNAALTLLAMGMILGSLFIGISWLAMNLHVVYWEQGAKTAPAVIDQISGAVFGKEGSPYYWAYITTQIATALILVLAANTSFADFPRLSSILAHDRFLPKQLSNLGDKLVFNNGIVILGVLAALLIVIKNGSVDALIPLYAIGVFTAFTLSQAGMVRHWFKERSRGWQVKAVINGLGAFATFIVLLDIAIEKFMDGAYIVIFLVAILVLMFQKIHRHYLDTAQQLKMVHYHPPTTPLTNTVLVLIPGMHRGVMPALEYARSLSADCRAVHIETDPEKTPQLKERWEQWAQDVPLIVLNSPYRALISPIMQYLDAVQTERRNHLVTVVVPEFVSTRWWHNLLHGQSGLRLKLALLGRKDVIVANVRYYLQDLGGPPPKDALAEEDPLYEAGQHGHAPPQHAPSSPASDTLGGASHDH